MQKHHLKHKQFFYTVFCNLIRMKINFIMSIYENLGNIKKKTCLITLQEVHVKCKYAT